MSLDNVIASPANGPAVGDLLAQLCGQRNIDLNNMSQRLELLATTRALTRALETPRETLLRYCWSEPAGFAAIRTAIDLGVFSLLPTGSGPKTVSDLATATKCDETFLARVLRHLGATGVLTETGPDEYEGTAFSTALGDERFSDIFPLFADRLGKGVSAIPEHAKENNYQSPARASHTPFQKAFQTEKDFFKYIQDEPHTLKQFANHMSTYHQGRPSWMDRNFYPVQERLLDDQKITSTDVLLVDVGGSTGHDLSEFRQKWPDAPGRLVLQDRSEVIAKAQELALHPSIEPMAHDFFTAQPVRGARAYYMHSVLHDWSDEMCRSILVNMAAAMKPGFSKLLINENVVPDRNASWEATGLDFIMMSVGAAERTRKDWVELVASAGLQILGIWTAHQGTESLIECELG
ncbi:Winged helix-turn-helix transcription repressor DNA-binding [Penicillium capsulatum]|uniref:Winged helix-turn-helix transcription repressor DNA-binding n=1 Tax=Penicillium capsulatum TaxID=69766 RepID=A0A9W9LWQ2_9EURO|nr:Winged helix-turn-helix transcription repressor DNA-binding [Penicillium capsulatum]